ncbi:Na+/H+ antiporter subunit E [Candidatus Hecatella orcuttiae]|uniref:Na+/H+ antiporter subunit E n=1 Tax=Candidatus Hecatella orcuttiae TaxID=1935119 RepID=UPI00286819CB|nr:Na+/H+ antiporter subunit E [Candidatus Hecatella orcuttiae]
MKGTYGAGRLQGLTRLFLVFIVLFGLWCALVGVFAADELLVGALSSLLVAFFTSRLMVSGGVRDKVDPAKWFWAVVYFVYYWFYAEVKAHFSVIKRILSPSLPIRPGIVKVPYTTQSDCGIVCVANSITNTPGTVTVEVDEAEKCYYVHWIDVLSLDPQVCRREISSKFEEYTKRFFS